MTTARRRHGAPRCSLALTPAAGRPGGGRRLAGPDTQAHPARTCAPSRRAVRTVERMVELMEESADRFQDWRQCTPAPGERVRRPRPPVRLRLRRARRHRAPTTARHWRSIGSRAGRTTCSSIRSRRRLRERARRRRHSRVRPAPAPDARPEDRIAGARPRPRLRPGAQKRALRAQVARLERRSAA